MKQKIKLISFDLDDTLWPCHPTIYQAEETLYRWLSDHVPVITERYDILQLREKRRQLLDIRPQLAHDLSQLRLHSFEMLARELDLDHDWIGSAFEVFFEARQNVRLFEDVRPTLDELSQAFSLVSLTNGNADPLKTGVGHWFDFSFSSAMVGKLKSEPDIYWRVQQQAGINAGQMVHVGDDPVQDVAGAKSAGVAAVWLNRGQQRWRLPECEPDAEIASLSELPALISEWNSKVA
jgi:FMN hydrolase / 5-amino-6-(5-phospho-D-ribitylamino)uracil phosphatase